MRLAGTLLAGVLALGAIGTVQASSPLKVGFVAPMTGAQAEYGLQMTRGIQVLMDERGNTAGGRKVEIITKDSGGPNPDVAKRLTQELIVKDRVDLLTGYGFSPNAFAAAPLATEAGIPLVIMNAATSSIPEKSPFIVRFSMTLAQHAYGIAKWANGQDIRRVYTLYADYGPGRDANAQFKKTFQADGGEIVGEIGAPLQTVDFGPYMQRIKDARPDALFMWFPSGELANTMLRAFRERGLEAEGIRPLGTSDLVDDMFVDAMGDAAVGLITAGHYSVAHDSAKNKAFLDRYHKLFGTDVRPNFMAVAAYDAMAAIYDVADELKGDVDGEAAMKLFAGMRMESPRGPISIDPETRDIVQNIYIRKTERVDGALYNVEFETLEAVKDPGK